MNIEIVKVSNRKQLKNFVHFPYELYKGCENWVPPLLGDEYDTFNRKKNGAFEYCDAECFLAYRDGKIVGRVAALVNYNANRRWNLSTVRFGWLDFINDKEVLAALLDKVAEWGKEYDCTNMKGPLGFTDMDKEGLLVDGYDKLSPFTCLYNYPYYDTLLSELGFTKDVDWTQKLVYLDKQGLEIYKHAEAVEKRYGLHVARVRSTRELCRKYGMSLFHTYNETFAPLFQFSPITDRQIKSYLATYVPILSKDFVCVVLDKEDRPVGFGFCVPTLSKAVKKSKGHLFPWGIFRIFHAIRHNNTLEALMVGVLPEYQSKGASILILKYVHENAVKFGIEKVILNPQLEENNKVQSLWKYYKTEHFMRRRSYSKDIV